MSGDYSVGLSIFRGGFDLVAAEQVSGAVCGAVGRSGQ